MSKKFFVYMISAALLFFPCQIYASEKVILGGDSVGIEARYDGVMINGTYTFHCNGKQYSSSKYLQKGDLITHINDKKITSIKEMQDALIQFYKSTNKDIVPISIIRNDQSIKTYLYYVYDQENKNFKSGIYVKDKITGIGTITFYEPNSSTYGCLGHEIMDFDTQQLAPVNNGKIYPATITSIKKSTNYDAGEKHGTIAYEKPIGTIEKNTIFGIYGKYSNHNVQTKMIECASNNEIHTGKAFMYTVVDGNEIKPYEIEITDIKNQQSKEVKGIVFKVIDQNLIQISNGIVQGMSGSPIVQDDKLIGAVTHVVVGDPIKGYGVFINNMLDTAS